MKEQIGTKKPTRKEQVLRDAVHARLQAEKDFIGDRTQLDALQEKARYQVLTIIPEDSPDKTILKDRADYSRQFDRTVKSKDQLTAAQAKQKQLVERYTEYNQDYFKLAGMALSLLERIEAGYLAAVEAEKESLIVKMNAKFLIDQEYSQAINVPVKNMNKEQKAAYTEMRAAAKAKMLKDVKALDIKHDRTVKLQEVKIDQSKITLSKKALTARINVLYPIREAGRGLSALAAVDLVEKMIKELSVRQAEGYVK